MWLILFRPKKMFTISFKHFSGNIWQHFTCHISVGIFGNISLVTFQFGRLPGMPHSDTQEKKDTGIDVYQPYRKR